VKLSNKELGKLGEDYAANWFRDQGYQILDRNWRTNRVELDLVVAMQDLVIFVEVKTRSNYNFGGAALAVSQQKISHLRQAALFWLKENKYFAARIRIDLVALQYTNDEFSLTHIRGVG